MNHQQFLVILFVVLSLAACTAPATPSPTVTSAPASTETPPPTSTPTPEPTPTSTPTPTTTPTPAPTPTPTPVPWTLEGAIDKLPEVYTEAVTPETIEQYTQLLSALPEEAQWWITGMGWGLEDLELDANEGALLELLVEKNVSAGMSILTRPDIIDGVTWGEVTWAQDYEVESLAALFEDDIEELQAQELLGEEGLAGINELIEMAATDFEIAKGLYLIDNFGHPDQRMFTYQVPQYNTQLHVLGLLAERGVPDDYEVAAVAAALDCGSLWTISDDEVRALIPEYTLAMIEYQEETEQIVSDLGAIWRPSTYMLEENITLMWGLPGSLYQDDDFLGGMQYEFRSRQFAVNDWIYSVFRLDYLTELRDYLLDDRQVVNSRTVTDLDALANRINRLWGDELLDYQWVSIDWSTMTIVRRIDAYGRNVATSSIASMNFQWELLQKEGRFLGGSGDNYILAAMDQAIGLPSYLGSGYVHVSTYGDPTSRLWRGGSGEIARESIEHPLDENVGWEVVRWDNWHDILQHHRDDRGARAIFLGFVYFSFR